ncbi:transporter, partial [Burkholderia glumae]|nr:transporter [Burkholderia glumae]
MKIVIKKVAGILLLTTVCISNAAFAQRAPGQLMTAPLLNSAFVADNAVPVADGPLRGTAATFDSGHFTSLSSSGPVTFSTPQPFAPNGTGATTALGATGNLQFRASLSGAGGRSVASKLSDVVSILDFPGCDKTGV